MKKISDSRIGTEVKLWNKYILPFEKKPAELQAIGKQVITTSRETYKLTDKMLKDKSLSKEERAEATELRKRAYNLTTELKKLNLF